MSTLAKRKPTDRRVRTNRDAEKVGQFAEAPEGGPWMERPPRRSAQHEIFQYRKARHQLHVLKDGADAEIEAFSWRANFD